MILEEAEMQDKYNLQHKAVIKEVQSKGKNILIIKGLASMYRTNEGMLQIDRDGELVNTDFMDLSSYRKNPVLVFQHNWDMPMGKITEIDNRNGVLAITAEVHRLSGQEHIFEAVEKGIIKSLSIGTIPEEIILRETHDGDVIEIARSTLVEISLTTVQSNQEALFDVVASKSPTMSAGAFAKQNGMSSEELKEKLLSLEKGVTMGTIIKKEVAEEAIEVIDKLEDVVETEVKEVVAEVKKPEVKEDIEKVEIKEEVKEEKVSGKLFDENDLAKAIVAANEASQAAIKEKEDAAKRAEEEAELQAKAAAKARIEDAFAYIKEQQEIITNTPDEEFDTDVVQDFYELVSDATEAVEAKVLGIIAGANKDDDES